MANTTHTTKQTATKKEQKTNPMEATKMDEFFPAIDVNEGTMPTGTVINFDNIDENAGFEPLPIGKYACHISTMEMRTSKNGNPMLSITFVVAAVHDEYKNRKLFTHFVLNNDISLGRLKKFLIDIFPDISLANVDLQELCSSGIGLGRACDLQVSQRPYDGKITNDVKSISAPSDMGML